MREIIPLKKDIIFNTKIGEITNINLEHDYKIKDDLVEGNVMLSGSYKMTEASVIEEDFFYKIPFGVALSKKINKDTIKIDIDDFKYEINKDVLSVGIDLEFSCEEEIITEVDEIIDDSNENEEEKEVNDMINEEDDKLINEYFNEEVENKSTTINEEETKIDIDENINNITNNITNNIINNENKYYTYKVYIVRQGDTIESICQKYNVTINDIKDYNDLSNINVNDKIIIPQINE